VDDAETECDLDEVTDWDWTIVNNGCEPEMQAGMQSILSWANDTLNS
jgi:hypothetical protein